MIACAVTTSLLGCLITGYLYFRYMWSLDLTVIQRYLLLIPFINAAYFRGFQKRKPFFDLEISGHTHGGQIFPFPVFAKLHNRYLAGLYKMDEGANMYVSRGVGQWGSQMRFAALSEITVLKLIPKQN